MAREWRKSCSQYQLGTWDRSREIGLEKEVTIELEEMREKEGKVASTRLST